MTADKYEKHEFRLIKTCGTFLYTLCETLKDSEKAYRETVVKDIRIMTEELLFLIQKANEQKAGCHKRIEMQKKALDLLLKIKELLPIVCKLCLSGPKKEGVLVKMLSDLEQPLYNWCVSDEKAEMMHLEKEFEKAKKNGNEAASYYNRITEWCKNHSEERYKEALEQSKALLRIRKKEYTEAKEAYDASVQTLYKDMTRDYSLLGDVIKEIDTADKRTTTQDTKMDLKNDKN